MINLAGLRDQACRYQREAHLASAEAMDLRIALARMGCRPTEEQVLMSRRFDKAAKGAADRAQAALQFLLFRFSSPEKAAELRITGHRLVEAQREVRRHLLQQAFSRHGLPVSQSVE